MNVWSCVQVHYLKAVVMISDLTLDSRESNVTLLNTCVERGQGPSKTKVPIPFSLGTEDLNGNPPPAVAFIITQATF